jgi:hypothetical protein
MIRRERTLPVPGKVLVRAGQEVGPTDVIIESNMRPEHLLLDIARGLGVSGERSDQYLHCQAGDQLAEGDVIAGPVGVARRVIRSPRDGRVVLAGSGQVLIEVPGKPAQLKAGLPGEVVELIADRGAIVETTGALIQGMWGNGQIDFGLMVVLAKSPDQVLTPDQLDVSLRGSVVLAAHCEQAETLKAAEELPLHGLILASMSPALIPVAARLQIPVILIEGFGRRPMNPVAFKLLTTNERREVALNAEPWDRYTGTRPEVIIPLPAPGSVALPRETDFFAPNQLVRVLHPPYASYVGTLVRLKGLTTLPNGLRVQAAEIQFENGKNIVLPLANLELLT